MKVAIASGKGGTGKTLVATNLAAAFGQAAYIDCDVEGANGHLFLKPQIRTQHPAEVPVPTATDACTGCGACEERCPFKLPVRDLVKQAGEFLKGILR